MNIFQREKQNEQLFGSMIAAVDHNRHDLYEDYDDEHIAHEYNPDEVLITQQEEEN